MRVEGKKYMNEKRITKNIRTKLIVIILIHLQVLVIKYVILELIMFLMIFAINFIVHKGQN